MVQMNENNPEYQPTVKPERETLLKKFDIPIDHLDFKYLETCNNAKEIEQILQILRSGEEGYFPDLLKLTEKRLFEVKPGSKLLKTTVSVLTKYDITKNEWQELSSDLQSWIEDVNKNDKELTSFQDIKPNINNVPVRESKAQKNKKLDKKTERIKSMDYAAWDKLDVDTEILKMDIKDEKLKEKTLKKVEDKEKLNTVVLDPDLMTKAELNHAALQAKNVGNECYKAKDFEEALQYYTNSLVFVSSAAVYNNRAITNIKLKNYGDAIKDCNEVLKLEKANEKAFLRKSTALKYLKQYDKAIETLEEFLQINPNSVDAQNLIHDIKKLSGKNDKVRTVRMKIQEHSENEKNTEIIQDCNTKEENNLKNVEIKEVIKKELDNNSTPKDNKYCDEKNINEEENQNKCVHKSKIADNEVKKQNGVLKKNINDQNIKTKSELDKNSKDKVLIPIPSTSKCEGPFYRVVNVPSHIAEKLTNTKKTHSKSDENIIDLNLPKNCVEKKSVIETTENVYTSSSNKNINSDNKENENKINKTKKISSVIQESENNDTNVSPYEFLKWWQAIKYDLTLQEHEKLLRSINPFDLVDGNKLDGDMFSILIKCLETRFAEEQDAIFVGNILNELQKIPRIDIIMLLMNINEKNVIRNLVERIKDYGYEFQENIYEKYNRLINN